MRLLALLLSLGGAGAGAAQQAAAPDAIGARVEAIADEYLAARRAAFPEQATFAGGPDARHDRLGDRSAAAEQSWRAREDRWLAQLRALDGQVSVGHPAWVTYGLLREHMESGVALRICRNRLWTVHPLAGWHANYAELAAQQPVGTPELRAQALARWSQLPRLVDQEIANLREGVAAGYTAPKPSVHRVLAALDRLLAVPLDESPFFAPARRDSTPDFRAAFERLVADSIRPAVRRYRDYLQDEYLAQVGEAAWIIGHPDGAACYRAAIRRYTTLDVSGEGLHRRGVEALAAAESTVTAVVTELGGDAAAGARPLLARLRYEPGMTFASRDAMRAAIDTIIARASAAAPRWFDRLPASALVVEPFPATQEGTPAPGEYAPPAVDGSRPGVFRVSLRPAILPGMRPVIEKLTMHEAIPGHHFQIGLARERPGAHPVTHLLGGTAFSEGWAIYAEELAGEMGLYSSPAGRLHVATGAVSMFAGLVAETGMYAREWSRSEAVEYLMRQTMAGQAGATATIDRGAGWPGRDLSYPVGYLEIRRLRALAERELGDRFDIREFHARVLEDGTITLPMLREKIEAWLRSHRV